MDNLFEVKAELRTDNGKSTSRRHRHAGKIPAIIYGGKRLPVLVLLNHNEFIRHLDEEVFYAHILTININGGKEQVVLKDLQRHPASDLRIMHADFLRIDSSNTMNMPVPLHFIGEDLAPGVKLGGLISHLMTDVEVTCLPKNLPEYIEVDVSSLVMDANIRLSELVLPEGVKLTALSHKEYETIKEAKRSSYDQSIVTIHAPRAAVEIEEDIMEPEIEEDSTGEE